METLSSLHIMGSILRVCLANKKLIVLVFFSGFLLQLCKAQSLTKINISEIPQRKIRNYIVSRSIDKMDDFSSIQASWKEDIVESDFNVIEKTFFLNYGLTEAWNFYRHANILRLWEGKSVGFGLLISKGSNSVINATNCSFHEIDTGDVYFLNLKVLRGLFNVEVAFEIINIDIRKHIMEFSYIDNNKSLGKQSIQFFYNDKGTTKIIHRTYFKSNSNIRDKMIYPHFHKKFINEFHKSMSQYIKDLPPEKISGIDSVNMGTEQ